MVDKLLGLLILAIPAVLILTLVFLFYLVFIKKKRTFLYTALLFLVCGLLLNPELYNIDTNPSRVERRYKKAVNRFNKLIQQDKGTPDQTKQKMSNELKSLRIGSRHLYLDYATTGELNKLIDNGDYKTMLSELDSAYTPNLIIIKRDYNNRSAWRRYWRVVFYIGNLIAEVALVISFIMILVTSFKSEKKAG